MKHLGIDFGTKRIGLAMSDDSGVLAFPHGIIPRDKDTIKTLDLLIIKNGVEALVIGYSQNETGQENSVQRHISAFVQSLQETCAIPIFYQDERFSSHHSSLAEGGYGGQVKRRQANLKDKGKMSEQSLDARAAATILQRYLDRQNKTRTLE